MINSVLRGVAEMDEETRRERTMVGLAVARARAGGYPPIASDEANVLRRAADENLPISGAAQAAR